MRRVAICVATFRRPALLEKLLLSLAQMRRVEDVTVEIRVADNDPEGSAWPTVLAAIEDPRITDSIMYASEPTPNIALARNKAVDLGPADFVLFIDDDEVADHDCLVQLLGARDRTGADAVIGFVGGVLPDSAPAWMWRGGFFDHPTGDDDAAIDWRGTRCGCTLVDGKWFYEDGLRFDPAFGRSGAEDVQFFARVAERGGWFTSTDKARALETVDASRASLPWLCRRAWQGGLCYHRLAAFDDRNRHPVTTFAARSVRSVLRAVTAVPQMARGRPESFVRGVLGLALAGGGLAAWLRPEHARQHANYGNVEA